MPYSIMTPRVTPDAVSADGGFRAVQGFREGSISTTTFLQRLVAAGYVYGATAGSATTPITALTTYAALRPEFVLRGADANICFIPMSMSVSFEVSTGTINEWSIMIGGGDPGNGTSSAATAGPLNLRTDKLGTTAKAVPRQHYTADETVFANPGPLEIWRSGQELATAAGAFAPNPLIWCPEVKPMLMGLSGLNVFTESTTTAQQYFLTFIWAETPLTWWN